VMVRVSLTWGGEPSPFDRLRVRASLWASS
jgi:hypothetical protein